MNERLTRDPDRPDDDIAELFAAQADAQPVPPALDARLRAAAREAALPAAGSASRDSAGEERRTEERQTRRHRVSGDRPPATLAPPRWLAAAAVLVLAVAIVPMLTKRAPDFGRGPVVERTASAPPAESSPVDASREMTTDAAATDRGANDVTSGHEEADATTGRDTATPAFVPRREARADGIAARATPSRIGPPTDDPTASESTKAEPKSPSPPASERTRAPDIALRSLADERAAASKTRALSLSKADAVAELAPSAQAEASIPDHERSPATWIEHLRTRLRRDGFTRELRDEYWRFRDRYPAFEPAFDPRAEVRTTSETEGTGNGEATR